ncbi:MAG: hypothetical protein R3C05_23850 [Pirellulaceae bacterium]
MKQRERQQRRRDLTALAGIVTIDQSAITSNSTQSRSGGIEIVDGDMALTATDLLDNDVNGLTTLATTPIPAMAVPCTWHRGSDSDHQ